MITTPTDIQRTCESTGWGRTITVETPVEGGLGRGVSRPRQIKDGNTVISKFAEGKSLRDDLLHHVYFTCELASFILGNIAVEKLDFSIV